MPSVLGLLEAREKKIREEVARLRVALDAAEQQLERLADARVTVAEVLAGPGDEAAAVGPVTMAGRIVPHWAEGLAADVLAPEYQQILSVLAGPGAVGGMRVKPLAAALGGELTPSRIEGVRSRVRRLVQRGWAGEVQPNVFTTLTPVVPAASE